MKRTIEDTIHSDEHRLFFNEGQKVYIGKRFCAKIYRGQDGRYNQRLECNLDSRKTTAVHDRGTRADGGD